MRLFVKYFAVLVLVLSAAGLKAQLINEDSSTQQAFFKASKFSSRCYAGLDASVVEILKNKAGGNFGVNLNWVINHKYVVTAIYDGTATQVAIQNRVKPADPNNSTYLTHRYVGAGFSYILFDNKLFSFQPGLTAGWGHIQYSYNNVTYHSNFAEIVPEVEATYNCTKYFRFGVGLNYRVALGASLNSLKSADISGVGGIIFIKVGTF